MSLLEDFARAVERDDSVQIESLLASGSIDVNARLPRDGNPPPLVFAARCEHPAVVEQLLSAGARIDDADDRGWTACHAAVLRDQTKVLAVLLEHRPNVEIKDGSNVTPLELGLFNATSYHVNSLMLIDAGASLDGVREHHLCWFASMSTAAIQALLNRGVVVNQLRGDEDLTPLHVVATRNRDPWSTDLGAVVNMLINVCGVDLEARDSTGSTCLQRAAVCSNYDALRCFLNAGADVNSLDNDGKSLLHCVYQYKCTILLLAAGADVNARDGEGQTAWQYCAADHGCESVLCAFLAAGADLSASDARISAAVSAEAVEAARRDIAKARLDFVRKRALQVCIGLQSLRLDALQLCEILQFACGPLAPLIAFHQWWKIATTVKHFH